MINKRLCLEREFGGLYRDHDRALIKLMAF